MSTTKYNLEYLLTGNTLQIEDCLGQLWLSTGYTSKEGEIRYKDKYLWINTGNTTSTWVPLSSGIDGVGVGRSWRSGSASNSGEWSADSSTLASITTININDTSYGGNNCGTHLNAINIDDFIHINKHNVYENFGIYKVNSKIDNSSYVTYYVTCIVGSGQTAGGVLYTIEFDMNSNNCKNFGEYNILRYDHNAYNITSSDYLQYNPAAGTPAIQQTLSMNSPNPVISMVGADRNYNVSGCVSGYTLLYPKSIVLETKDDLALRTGDRIGSIMFRGNNGSTAPINVELEAEAGENLANPNDNAAEFNIKTISTADTTTPVTRINIDKDGDINISSDVYLTNIYSVVDGDVNITADRFINLTSVNTITLDPGSTIVYAANLLQTDNFQNDGFYRGNLTETSSSSYSVLSNDYTIICTYSSGNVTVNLPAASSSGQRILIIKNSCGTTPRTVAITAAGLDKIILTSGTGSGTLNLSTNGYAATLQCDGSSKWYVISALAATSF